MSYEAEGGYLDLLADIKEIGIPHNDRTGTGTKRLIAQTMRFDLSNNSIPVFTTKKVHWKSVVIELLWFLSGQTNINFLKKHGVRIWNEWANSEGQLGPVYGKQFREQSTEYRGYSKKYPLLDMNNAVTSTVDPLSLFINGLKDNPESRRHIISLWNQAEIQHMNLPPCHGVAIQASVIDGGLYLEMYQRSCDMFLGVPFNVASYSLFAHMIAKECGLEAKEFIWHGHDCHIYDNHHKAVDTQLEREPMEQPNIKLDYSNDLFQVLDNIANIESYTTDEIMEGFKLEGYEPHPTIKAEVSI